MIRSRLDEAFRPYELRLQAQVRFRKALGVREVDQPTYQRYVTGPIERFDRRRNAFQALSPDNPFGVELRKRFRARTGYDNYTAAPPYSELEAGDHVAQSLAVATRRMCREYLPAPLAVTSPEERLDVTDKAWISRLIKKVALFLGADMVRITRVDPRWVYQDVQIPHEYAIIAVVSHARTLLRTAPSYFSWLATADTYSRLKFITTQLTDFICGLGYDAMYRETLGHNPEMLMVPLAIDAGIGEFSRNGRVLSPEFGNNMRLKAVTTNLPLDVDKPISFGLHEFCMACESCAIYCPPQALPYGPPADHPIDFYNNSGCRKWYVNAERCLTFWAMNKKKWMSCGGRCMAVCPWSKPQTPLHNLVRWMAIHSPEWGKKILASIDRRIYRPDKVPAGTDKP